MPNDTDLIESLRRRIGDPRNRTDHPKRALPTLAAPATAKAIARAEAELGFKLPELLARIYREIANGGFGPGYGIIGLTGGYLDNGRSIVDLYRELKPGSITEWQWPDGLLPICDWGCEFCPALIVAPRTAAWFSLRRPNSRDCPAISANGLRLGVVGNGSGTSGNRCSIGKKSHGPILLQANQKNIKGESVQHAMAAEPAARDGCAVGHRTRWSNQ